MTIEAKVFYTTKGRKVGLRTFSLYPKDNETIDRLAEHFGCSRSEVVRSAVRAFAAQTLPEN